MKLFFSLFLIICTLCGCSAQKQPLEQATALREKLLTSEYCSFQTVITADYGETIHTFKADCSVDKTGELNFIVTYPDTISGISGSVTEENASLTFENKVLAFPMLADGQISPVCSPWLFMEALRGGYISGCSQEDTGLSIYIDDSFRDFPLQLEIYTDTNTVPVHVDFIWQNRRILSLDIENFNIL